MPETKWIRCFPSKRIDPMIRWSTTLAQLFIRQAFIPPLVVVVGLWYDCLPESGIGDAPIVECSIARRGGGGGGRGGGELGSGEEIAYHVGRRVGRLCRRVSRLCRRVSCRVSRRQCSCKWNGRFLVACTRLYKSLCRSVGRSVGLSVGLSVCRSVCPTLLFLHF